MRKTEGPPFSSCVHPQGDVQCHGNGHAQGHVHALGDVQDHRDIQAKESR